MSKTNYADLRAKLDKLLEDLNDTDLDIDEAISKHAEAQEVLSQLEAYLKQAERKIKAAPKNSKDKN